MATWPLAMTIAPSSNASEMSLFVGVPLASSAMAVRMTPSHGRATTPPPYPDITMRSAAIGNASAVYMNWLRMSPVNSPLKPSSVKTLPANRPNLGLRNCVNVAFMSPEAGCWFVLGQQQKRVHRHDGAGSRLHAVPEAAVAVEFEEPARPEAQLAGVDVERVVGVAPEVPAGVLAAAHDALRTQEDVRVEHHALLAELVAQPPPAAGEPRPIPEVAAPGRRDVVGLRRGQARDGGQQHQAKEDHQGVPSTPDPGALHSATSLCRGHSALSAFRSTSTLGPYVHGILPVSSITLPARSTVILTGAPDFIVCHLLADPGQVVDGVDPDPVHVQDDVAVHGRRPARVRGRSR